ncbi:translation initiation factor IF-2-like [Mustela putorius furo]|uniref:Translation initiation factor IF-2-like n=1 Tax=Mustela putorius furo TaxID=9669 RepID=A0A8U0SA81_MUSPF|nr:translation initiation factor IF-2-like [Mustela putorius furo]
MPPPSPGGRALTPPPAAAAASPGVRFSSRSPPAPGLRPASTLSPAPPEPAPRPPPSPPSSLPRARAWGAGWRGARDPGTQAPPAAPGARPAHLSRGGLGRRPLPSLRPPGGRTSRGGPAAPRGRTSAGAGLVPWAPRALGGGGGVPTERVSAEAADRSPPSQPRRRGCRAVGALRTRWERRGILNDSRIHMGDPSSAPHPGRPLLKRTWDLFSSALASGMPARRIQAEAPQMLAHGFHAGRSLAILPGHVGDSG